MTDLSTFEDFYVDPTTGDLSLDDSGQMLGVTGAEAVAQWVRTRLLTNRGEWFLDESIGVPWTTQVLVKNPDMTVIRATIATEILDVEGVARITQLDLSFAAGSRTLTIDFQILTDEGVLIGGTVP